MTTTTLDAGKNDVEKVTARITSHLGPPSEWWWPGGWPGDIEAALVDAVFSARAVYRSKNGKGIYANVAAWRAGRDRTDWSLDELIAEIDGMGVDAWAGNFGNRQHSPTRPPSALGGPSKAATVREAAGALREQGINTATDIGLGNTETAQRVLAAVPGIGRGTANYFLMLLGAAGARPDRMVHRFLRDEAGHAFSDAQAESAVIAAAERLSVQPHVLAHAIWRYES
ncbi:MAG TPA: hypothetical protein VNH17_16235, partial [Streptosporangiaceae bacterium]|nr:hypothetical protein [Streptosporangiaceae bacterium]